MATVYDLGEQFEGNTLRFPVLSVKRKVNDEVMTLEGAEISFEVYRSNTSQIYLQKTTQGGGINILDEVLCIFQILPIQNPGLTEYTYVYKITITYANGDIKTYINGKLPIVKFNTRKYVYSNSN